MTEDKEKRFQRIMDKLYYSPKPKPKPKPAPSSGTGGTNAQHKGRMWELGSRAHVENSTRHTVAGMGTREGRTPPCRPWDRGDLMKRLATFKAMTWFGKPKAIDPVNCARRGWTNVDVDTLACEACGARLFFSVPSSWTLPQVEKAAAVFSLKLDNGHKLLCPWIDNICDEALAFFPPTPAPALIESYKKRSTALLQLSALPAISSSALNYMRSPQLEDFLANSSSIKHRLDGGIKLTASSGSMVFDGASVEDVSTQYYQALKITSLCGWEPRVLSYVVDRVDSSSHYVKTDKTVEPELQSNKNPGFVVYSSTVSGEGDGERRDQISLADCDPSSVVLDCKLCGACAGMWAFATISRPVEFFNLTESPEEDEQSGPATGSNGPASNEKPFSLNLTIAGGPPPTRQTFKPRITLPIVTRHLKSVFGSNGDIRNCASVDAQDGALLNTQNSLEFLEGNRISNLSFPSETPGALKRKRNENEYSTPGGSSCYSQPLPEGNVNVNVEANTPSSSGKTGCEDGSGQVCAEVNKCLQGATEELIQSSMVTEDAENGRSTDAETRHDIDLQPGDTAFACITTDIILPRDDGISEDTSVVGTTYIYRQDNSVSSGMTIPSHSITEVNHNSQNIACGVIPEGHVTSEVEVNKNSSDMDDIHREGGHEIHAMQSHINESTGCQNVLGSKALNSVDAEVVTLRTSRNNPTSSQGDDADKFDPVRKHRPFCPWIAQTHDDIMPGWKLTLRAVVKDECSPRAEPPSSFADEVDDPIVSVRKLFTSPPSKRFKGSQSTL